MTLPAPSVSIQSVTTHSKEAYLEIQPGYHNLIQLLLKYEESDIRNIAIVRAFCDFANYRRIPVYVTGNPNDWLARYTRGWKLSNRASAIRRICANSGLAATLDYRNPKDTHPTAGFPFNYMPWELTPDQKMWLLGRGWTLRRPK